MLQDPKADILDIVFSIRENEPEEWEKLRKDKHALIKRVQKELKKRQMRNTFEDRDTLDYNALDHPPLEW